MNFQTIPPIESSKAVLDSAFRKAREKGRQKNLKGNWLQIIRRKESLKLDIVTETITARLETILKHFPLTKDLSSFYQKLMKLTIDLSLYQKSLGAVNWARQQVRAMHGSYVSKTNRTTEREKIKHISTEFYGRVSSIVKQIDDNLKYLETVRKTMRTYPDIKDMFTICIYGFPNVGKTTLLNNLTGSTANVAAYAFTTKEINAGYFTSNGKKIQVLDVPGTLARQDKLNNIELQAELVRTEVANLIIYVFDLSEQSGYSMQKQEQLFHKIGSVKPVFIYLAKEDITDQEKMKNFAHKHYSLKELKEKIASLA